MMSVTAHPRTPAAELAVEIYRRTLDAVRADRLVEVAVRREGELLFVQDVPYDLSAYRRVLIAGVGKASTAMARSLGDTLGPHLSGGVVVTKRGFAEPLDRLEVLESSHPVPDESSLEAGRRLLDLANSCGPDDLVLFLLSGGASALAESPVEGVSLEDLQVTNRALLASGADITLMNAVRSKVSRLKAGGLARAFHPATVVALVLSDVVGNALGTIGSGPLIAPTRAALPFELLDVLPNSVRTEVLAGELEEVATPKVPHHVVGSVSVAVHAAADAARRLGIEALPFQDPLQGEARDMARQIMAVARRHAKANPKAEFCMVFGGETTVTLRGKGRGGRCQEMALAAASSVARLPNVAFLAAGTDGNDGPTEAAGGLVDRDSIALAQSKGVDARKALIDNDSHRFLAASEGLVVTGPTGSNVNDICLVVQAS